MRPMQAAFSRMSAIAAIAALALALPASEAFSGEKSARFRAGTVISAEISSAKPEVLDESPFEPYKETKGLAWAEVVVRLDKGRSLGVTDYVLVHSGNEYKCLAIAEDDKIYSVRDQVFEKTNIFGCYRLLFPIQFPQNNKNDFELRFKLLASPMPDVPLKVRHLGATRFTETEKIPPEGSLGVLYVEKEAKKPAPPAPVPAKPAAPAAPAATPAAPAPAKK